MRIRESRHASQAAAPPSPEAVPEAPKTDAPAPGHPPPKKPKKVVPPPKNGADGTAAPASEPAQPDKYAKLVKCWPPWASDELTARKPGHKMTKPAAVLFREAFDHYANASGVAAMSAMRAFFHHETTWTPERLKKKIEKAVAAGDMTLVKGKGLNGHYKRVSAKKSLKRVPKGSAKGAASQTPKEPLENHFGEVFLWATHPKEASIGLIKKYLIKHFPMLNAENGLRKALEQGEAQGKYKRITGKGMMGTFQLMDGADKSGQLMDDAIEDAVIAMNEPKEVSIPSLRDYMDEYHPDYRTNLKPHVLKTALDRAEARGWITRISGKGFSGTFRLAHPYYPDPRSVWGKAFEGHKGYTSEKGGKLPKFTFASEDELSEDEPEYIPRKRKAPAARAAPKTAPRSGPKKGRRV